GFIVLSTGSHDYPVAHWSAFGLPYTEQLRLAARESPIARYYKFDAVGYFAEGDRGELLAAVRESDGNGGTSIRERRGTLRRLVWDAPLNTDEQRTSWEWQPPIDDSPSDGFLTVDGPDGLSFHLDYFDSWRAALRGYRDSFGPINDSIRAGAERLWLME